MPDIIVKVRSQNWTKGPTKVAMDYDKTVIDELGPNVANRGSKSAPWVIKEPPYTVLNRLEHMGYRVVAMASNNQGDFPSRTMWTLTNTAPGSASYHGASNF